MRVSTVHTSEARSYASTVSTSTLSPVLSSSYLQVYRCKIEHLSNAWEVA